MRVTAWVKIATCGVLAIGACQGRETSTCGDGMLDGPEACDDGNIEEGDYCAADCAAITGRCGDGAVQAGEACDDGNHEGGDRCSPRCSLTSVCGDGVVELDEECDDGNASDGDRCSSACVPTSVCGDGIVELEEACDPGGAALAFCSEDCARAVPACVPYEIGGPLDAAAVFEDVVIVGSLCSGWIVIASPEAGGTYRTRNLVTGAAGPSIEGPVPVGFRASTRTPFYWQPSTGRGAAVIPASNATESALVVLVDFGARTATTWVAEFEEAAFPLSTGQVITDASFPRILTPGTDEVRQMATRVFGIRDVLLDDTLLVDFVDGSPVGLLDGLHRVAFSGDAFVRLTTGPHCEGRGGALSADQQRVACDVDGTNGRRVELRALDDLTTIITRAQVGGGAVDFAYDQGEELLVHQGLDVFAFDGATGAPLLEMYLNDLPSASTLRFIPAILRMPLLRGAAAFAGGVSNQTRTHIDLVLTR